MLRKLPLAIAIALAVAPFQSQALGLGKIETRSVLNQPFDAEIQLLSVPPGELDGVRVNLATPEAFDRADIDRPYLLSKLRFKTLRKANGDAAIEVFSRDAIQEPYLNFLVEVNWPKGRMVREFTVLLDPPLTTGRRAAAVATPTSVSTPVSPVSPVSTRTVQPESMARVASEGEYGPVQRDETLWSIANATRPAGASANQMMLAILKANPLAFGADNINTLKAGSILRIPSVEEVQALTAAEARQIANQHYEEWKQGAVATAPVTRTAETTTDTPSQPSMQDASADEEARLKLSGSDVAGQSGAGEDAEAIKQELLAAQEKVITAQSESDEIRGQMEDMQAELLDLKRLLELKDKQLAQLQAANDESMAATEDAAEVTETMVEEAVAEEAVEEAIEETVEEAAEVTESMVEETVEAVEEAVEEAAVEPVAEETAPPAPVAAPVEQPEEKAAPPKEQTLLEMITGSATMMGIAVAVLVVLLALIWAAFSRRNKAGKPMPPPQKAAPATAEAQPDAVAAAVEDTQPAVEDTDDDTSFLSEFTPADLDELNAQETGEVDPISEADVYIAYGRFDQAEELVLSALEQEPGKVSYQHKLLEIYYANKDEGKFTALAQSMAEAGAEAEDPDAWNRAKLMGGDLDPENPLFADAMDAVSQDITEDLDMALSELESQLTDDADGAVADLNVPSEDLEELDLDEIAGKATEEGIPELGTAAEAPFEQAPEEAVSETVSEEDAAIEELAAELEAFDIDALSESEEAAGTVETSQPAGDSFGSDDDLLLNDDLDDLGGLDEIDDVSTKIDLARAYVEMGDKEGAKGILEEVLEEGSEAQKQEAQTLIAEIS